jgi:ketosteroid isomerase-like protein
MIRWLLAFALALTALPAVANPKDNQALVDHGTQWAALYEAGKIDEMRPLYETDAVLMTDGTTKLMGVDVILQFLGRNKERGNQAQISFENEDVQVDGKYGFLTAKYWLTIETKAGQKFEVAGRSLLIFKRGKDKKWRIWRDIDNKAPDVTPASRPKTP